MSDNNHTTFLEWLYTEEDGSLLPGERRRLEAHLAGCESCRREREAVSKMDLLLESSRIPVEDAFTSQVMDRLPAAGWEARHPRTWVAALLCLVLFGGLGAALLGISAAQFEPAAPLLATLGSIGDMLKASLLAGAGLLTASWKGLGAAVGQVLQGSKLNLIVLIALVGIVDLLFLRLLTRRRRVAQESAARSKGNDVSSLSG
jgi:hypothetical protein